MGRVLFAGLDADDLDERLDRVEIESLTTTTVPDPEALRKHIEQVRSAGWAAVDQELEEGVRSAAVPIRDAQGRASAAMNVSVHATRMTMPTLRREVVPKLLKTAEAIESDLHAAGSATNG
jgi:IclR family pca regulon transcriptional regulator